MPIRESQARIVWGRAGGRCSREGCGRELTNIVRDGEAHHLGELAHIIGSKPTAARAEGEVGSDNYDNLLLLCPSCHTEIDKAPASFPVQLLHDWKSKHEAYISTAYEAVALGPVDIQDSHCA